MYKIESYSNRFTLRQGRTIIFLEQEYKKELSTFLKQGKK